MAASRKVIIWHGSDIPGMRAYSHNGYVAADRVTGAQSTAKDPRVYVMSGVAEGRLLTRSIF
jgi:hypothetical protein